MRLTKEELLKFINYIDEVHTDQYGHRMSLPEEIVDQYLEGDGNVIKFDLNNIQLKEGQQIYVDGSMYMSHGKDDFAGGLATISKITYSDHLPEDHMNYTMVSIKERPGHGYNWNYLKNAQEELSKKYGDQIAHPDPDDRPQFNTGW